MRKYFWAAAAATAAVAAFAGSAAALTSSPIYDAVPASLPTNVVSLGFQATSTSEFGDNVVFAGTNRRLAGVVVTMSAWAKHSEYPLLPASGWTHPITFNVYAVDHSTATPAAGALLATVTQVFTIPWRPEADPTCSNGTAWRAGDGACYNGLAFNITFDFSALNVVLPNEIVFGVAYNTQSYGATPIGTPGPYNSLNVGVPDNNPVTVGADANTDTVFWNTSHAGFYTDEGAGGVGTFREDTNWTPYGTVAARFLASDPLVGPPTSKKECKKDGWQTFNNPSFSSKKECERYVKAHDEKGHDDEHSDDDHETETDD